MQQPQLATNAVIKSNQVSATMQDSFSIIVDLQSDILVSIVVRP
jgi:hypothetical protein